MKNAYNFSNIKKIKWGVLEENEPISFFPIMAPGWSYIINKTGKILGKYQKSILCLQKGKRGWIYVDHKEWNELGVFVLQKIIRNPKLALRWNKEILKLSDQLTAFVTKEIFAKDLSKKSRGELIGLMREYDKKHGELYAVAIIPVYLELYKPNLTKYLVEYLDKQIVGCNYARTAKECFAILTSVEKPSKVQLEENSLTKIAIDIKKDKQARKLFESKNKRVITEGLGSLDSKLRRNIEKHIEKFKYLGYNFEGPAFPDSYFLRRLREIVVDNSDPSQRLKKIARDKSVASKLIRKINEDLSINKKYLQLFEIAREIIYGKDYRKMSLVESYYKVEPLLREISKRFNLSIDEVRGSSNDELEKIANGNAKKPVDMEDRLKESLFVVIDKKLPGKIIVGNTDVFNKIAKHLKKIEDFSEVSYFHGQTASIGKAKGIVRIINNVKELAKMKKGDVLVSQMTNPDLVPAMKKASAIITDLGGITCHAAIISRELKIPCVIGTRNATKILKDGDLVEVDAFRGEIRKI